MATGKKGKARGASKGAPPPQRAPASAKAQRRAVKAVRLVRKGKSLTAAAKTVHADPRTVKKYARVALRRKEGTYRAVPVDHMRRPLRMLTDGGLEVVDVRSSRTASRIARYWAAVDHYLRTGDRRRLQPFAGRGFRSGGVRRAYVTDPQLLEQLANAGEVRFEDLYETTA